MNNLSKNLRGAFAALQSILIIAAFTVTIRAAGEVDPAFNVAVQETTQGSVETIIVQPDGKLLVGGNFGVADNTARSSIARFNADGTVDQSFNPPDFFKATLFGTYVLKDAVIYAVAVQADGKIIVGGDFNKIGATVKRGIARLNADGSLDNSFGVTYYTGGSDPQIIYDIKIQSDNQILIGGDFYIRETGASDQQDFARLNLNGSIDTSFQQQITGGYNSSVRSFVIQPDGKIVYAVTTPSSGGGSVWRINPNGVIDNSFNQVLLQGSGTSIAPFLNKIVLQTDGKFLVGGLFLTVNGFSQNNLTRINVDGSLDSSFNVNGTGANQPIKGIAVLPDGKIVIGGQFDTFNSIQRKRNARLNANGTLDTTYNYNPGNAAIVNDIKVLGDGKVILGGSDSGGTWDKISRLNTDGTFDTTFVGAIYQKGIIFKVIAQPDGKVIIGGVFRKVNGIMRLHLARLNQDGSVDTSFVANADNGGVYSQVLQADGKILVTGAFFGFNGVSKPSMARLNTNGSVDTTFTAAQSGYKAAVLPDGKILVAGFSNFNGSNFVVSRLNSNGSIDTSFNQVTAVFTNAVHGINVIKLQPDGKILIGGDFTQINGVARGRFARLNADGTLDTAFNPPFGANAKVNDLAIQSNGSVIIGGEFLAVNGSNNRPYLARLFSDGTLDANFTASANNFVYTLEIQSDDKILVGGIFTQINGVSRFGIARLKADGTFDNSFGSTGTNDAVNSIFIQSDNNILIGGEFTRVDGISRVNIARLLNAAAAARTRFDFDGDGRADVAVFRPSNGNWFVLPSQSNSFYGFPFGQASDQIAPADFDGDGKTDVAVFRDNVTGAGDKAYFYILNSSDNSFRPAQFGTQGDVPMTGDWDGDGKADLAVYRAATTSGGQSYFYYRPSSQPTVDYLSIALGALGDKPLLGDFDGDGRLDPAVFRASTATWYIIKSSVNQLQQTTFGVSTDIPVPADYDGDGAANIAVFRPSNGYWYTSQNPATNYGAIQFGASGDLPVAADFDGDGKADVAIFRPSSGAWYVNRTTAGFYGVQFGTSGDKLAPNAYIR